MRIVNVYEAKTQLSKLLDAVEQGEEIVIARRGRPIADLRRHERPRRGIVIGGMADEIDYHEADLESADEEITGMFYAGRVATGDDPGR